MSDYAIRELSMALRRARVDEPDTLNRQLQRLHTLDVNKALPRAELLRIEFIMRSRQGRFTEALTIARQLATSFGYRLTVLEEDLAACPETKFDQFQEHQGQLARLVSQQSSGGSPKGFALPKVSGFAMSLGGAVLVLVVLAGVAAKLILDRRAAMEPKAAEVASVVEPESGAASDSNVSRPIGMDEISRLESHVVHAYLEFRIAAKGGSRWWPTGSGTAFPIGKGLYLTNRHVAKADQADIAAFEEKYKTKVSGQRVVLVGRFGWEGDPREIIAKVYHVPPDKIDDLAVLTTDENVGYACTFVKVPPRRTRVMTIGFPGISERLSKELVFESGNQTEFENELFREEALDPDRSVNLVKLIGPLNLVPTVTDGIISKELLAPGLLQTNAVIAGGNSGGPLVDELGRVVGVNTWGSTTSDSFTVAIRSDRIRELLSKLKLFDSIKWEFPDE